MWVNRRIFKLGSAINRRGRRIHGGVLTNIRELEQELWEVRGNEYTQPQLGVCLMR
jgi:hypothetical protein